MNIGFEAKRFFTNYTGLGNYSRFVVDALSAHNAEHQYYLFTPRAAVNNEVSAILNRPGVAVIKPGGLYRAVPSIWRTWGVSLNSHIKNLDIFHGLSQELPFNLPRRIKKVVTVHDLIFYRFPRFYHAADVVAVGNVLLVRTFSASSATVHQSSATNRPQRSAASVDERRRGAFVQLASDYSAACLVSD